MTVAIAVVALGHWYHKGLARMIQHFDRTSKTVCGSDVQIRAWINTLPPGAPSAADCTDNEVCYWGYCAKPFAFKAIKDQGADIGLLLDASFVPIANIQPLIDYVAQRGYYMAPDGFKVGQWMSDKMLQTLCLDREETLGWNGCQSGCVGIDFRKSSNRHFVDNWASLWPLFAGHHSNDKAATQKWSYKNVGPVSDDPRVLGHRHDQSALAVVAKRFGMDDYVNQPRFSSHEGGQNRETVLVCRGL
jgi:hypothetical protein